MSMHLYLYCEATGECVETVAVIGDKTTPRTEPNALGAFLTYHFDAVTGAAFEIVELDSIAKNRNTCNSLADLADECESIGSFDGYRSPIMVWNEQNYREFMGRRPNIAAMLQEMERDAGVWVVQPQT